MLTWPHSRSDWAPILPEVEPVFLQLANEISRREFVLICCYDDQHRAYIADLLLHHDVDLNAVRLYVVPSNDTWARDHGPIAIRQDDALALIDFTFNGWGGKYPADLDNRITVELHHQGAFGDTPLIRDNLVLEGGSIDTDGMGSLLTTTHCLLSGTRNPALEKRRLENRLRETLGVQHILWLEHGYLEGDDTDGHVDTLARFCNPSTIAYVDCADEADPQYAELRSMAAELRLMRDVKGQPYSLVPLPLPAAIHDESGQRLPATYANFLIINGAVLVPVYQDPADEIACTRLAEVFPDREIIPVNCRPLIQQYGSLHCVTMQIPQGILNTEQR